MERYFSGLVRNFDAFFYDFWVGAVGCGEISIYVGGGLVGVERFRSGLLGRSGRLERESGVRRRRSEPFGAVLEGFGAVFWVVAVAWSESPVCVGGGLSRLEWFWRVLERYFGS